MNRSLTLIGIWAALFQPTLAAQQDADTWTTAGDEVREAARAIGEATSESAQRAWESTKHYSKEGWDAAKEYSKQSWEATKDFSERAWDETQETFRDNMQQAPAPVETRNGEPRASGLEDATYAGIYDQPVTLTNGRYEGAPFVAGSAARPTLTLVEELDARGDLNGDGASDAAVLLVEQSGGSGSFLFLAVMGLSDAGPRNLATTQIGDRIQVRDLSLADGEVILDMLVAGEDEALAHPATKVLKRYRLERGILREAAVEDLGPLSAADLAGSEWTLRSSVGENQETPAQATISMRFEGGRIAGMAGCNRYFADLQDEGGGAVALGPIGTTRMACPPPQMEEEQAFIERLASVERFGFRFGDLVLSGPDGTLVFKRAAQ